MRAVLLIYANYRFNFWTKEKLETFIRDRKSGDIQVCKKVVCNLNYCRGGNETCKAYGKKKGYDENVTCKYDAARINAG